MERVLLNNIDLGDNRLSKLHVFLDDHGKVLILPLLWCIHISNTETIFKWRITGKRNRHTYSRKHVDIIEEFINADVSRCTIENYIGHVFNFLKHMNLSSRKRKAPSVHNSELYNSDLINHYINEVLAKQVTSSSTIIAHAAAIKSYYNFLFKLNIKDEIDIKAHPKTLKYISYQNPETKKISYITKEQRLELLKACHSRRDKIIIKLGYEVGLRTSELRGLLLSKHKAAGDTHLGLLDLFKAMEENPKQEMFEYLLNGKYTKGGRSRDIYFKKDLLTLMKEYYEFERKNIIDETGSTSNTLLLRSDPEGRGKSIGQNQGSNLFKKIKVEVPYLDQNLSFHDLRHTFATELYHEEITGKHGIETRSESGALLEVGRRLGHAEGSNVTRRYIRLRMQMLNLENA